MIFGVLAATTFTKKIKLILVDFILYSSKNANTTTTLNITMKLVGIEVALTLWGNQLSQALQDTFRERPKYSLELIQSSHPSHAPLLLLPQRRKQNVKRAAKMHRSIYEFLWTRQDFQDRYIQTFKNMTDASSPSLASVTSSLHPDLLLGIFYICYLLSI